MIVHTLAWDSELLQKKIGEIYFDRQKRSQLKEIIQKAKKQEFQYLICRLRNPETAIVKALESSDFYLSDIGVTWNLDTQKDPPLIHKKPVIPVQTGDIKIAGIKDIPLLQKMITSMFVTSRFYSDPFFTRSEANKLYQKWIENSVRGDAADIVFFIPRTGLATCKRTKHKGDIVLIGVIKTAQGKGIGTLLLKRALQWFQKNKIHAVSARTQLKNIAAMNFYRKAGFTIAEYDLVFSKIL